VSISGCGLKIKREEAGRAFPQCVPENLQIPGGVVDAKNMPVMRKKKPSGQLKKRRRKKSSRFKLDSIGGEMVEEDGTELQVMSKGKKKQSRQQGVRAGKRGNAKRRKQEVMESVEPGLEGREANAK